MALFASGDTGFNGHRDSLWKTAKPATTGGLNYKAFASFTTQVQFGRLRYSPPVPVENKGLVSGVPCGWPVEQNANRWV